MPSNIIICALCEKQGRHVRSKYTKISTSEREEKVRQGYRLRRKKDLNESIFNKHVHIACYKALVFDLPSVSVVGQTGRPKHVKGFFNRTLCSNKVLIDITNNQSSTASAFNCYATKINSSTFQRKKIDSIRPTVITSCFSDDDEENQEPIKRNYKRQTRSSILFDNSTPRSINRSLFGPNDGDFSFIAHAESDLIEVQSVCSSISIDQSPTNHQLNRESDKDLTPKLDDSITELRNSNTEKCTLSNNDNYPIIINRKKLRKRQCRSQRSKAQAFTARSKHSLSTSGVSNCTIPPHPETTNESSSLFSNGFEELCTWLLSILHTGSLVSLIDITKEYELILNRRQEKVTCNILRNTSLRDRIQNKLDNIVHFEKISNYNGIFVALSDVSFYVRTALQQPNIWQRSNVDRSSGKKEDCENFIQVIEQLRDSIKSHSHIYQQVVNNTSTLINFDTNLFWVSVPLILKNFIGTLTLSDESFGNMRKNYNYYDHMNKDMYKSSSKWLKIASCCSDLIYVQNYKNIMPKHYLLGNEIYRHERSKQLLSITNQLGHTPSYNTILRLHHDAAAKARDTTDPFLILQQHRKLADFSHNFTIKVADNFDINPETLYGNKSIHILNQILISTPENDEIPHIIREVIDYLLDEIHQINALLSFDDPVTVTPILIDNLSCFSYKMFEDNSSILPLLGYGLLKYANDSTRQLNLNFSSSKSSPLPLMSGFFAQYLPSKLRPFHNVSFLKPINKDPSAESTADACLDDTTQLFVDSKYQQEGILVVDEKIYRSCLKVKRRKPDIFRNIFVYAGDFHLMKNMMIVIWSIVNGSGIEGILETMYKGATLRGIFEVHNFNKSLRCCKLLYTALQILWLESFISDTSSNKGK